MEISHLFDNTYAVEKDGKKYRAHYQPLACRLDCSFNIFCLVSRKNGGECKRELNRRGPLHFAIRNAIRGSEAFRKLSGGAQ